MRKISIATASQRYAKQWANKTLQWGELVEQCRTPQVTRETVAEYARMTKDEQSKIKDVGGFVGGYLTDGKRNKNTVKFRDIICLDIDTGKAGVWEKFCKEYPATEAFSYSTHKHTEKCPRLRLVLLLDRSISPEEYGAISRAIAAKVGLEFFDPTTYAPERLMYWPSRSKDGDWFFARNEGSPLCADDVLDTYIDWRDTSEWPESTWESKDRRRECKKQGDPCEKQGMVGYFCRTYDIRTAIEEFLPDVYEELGPDRYTYKLGTVSAGLVLYEDGKFAYSHNATDPCSQQLVNAFDLVRLHKFGHLDEGDTSDAITKKPSYQAMCEFASKDKRVRHLIADEKTASIEEDFKGIKIEGDEEEEGDWRDKMITNNSGSYRNCYHNLCVILEKHPVFVGKLWYNDFNGKLCVDGPLPWGANKEGATDYEWTNADDSDLRVFLDTKFGLTGKDKIFDAFISVARKQKRHPVKDYLTKLNWDGEPRLETLLVDFLGAANTELTRAFTRKHFIAAVARVMRLKEHDGKYDQILSIVGKEGLGKSTLLRRLAGDEWFNDSIYSLDGKEGMEALQGSWLVEVAELIGVKRAENEAVKAFLSREADKFRPAYGRVTETRKRECVFFATTNEKSFLTGDTGNRRYWIVESGVCRPTKDVFNDLTPEYRDHIWAEAMHYYMQGESKVLESGLLKEAVKVQEAYNEVTTDERIGVIKDYLDKRLPADWATRSPARKQAFFKDLDPLTPDGVLRRDTISNVEIHVECFGGSLSDPKLRYKTREISSLMARVEGWEKGGTANCGEQYGKQRIYKRIIKEEDSDEEL